MSDFTPHAEELDSFIADVSQPPLNGPDLLTRFKEDITPENLTKSSNSFRRKLRDYLEDHQVPCGRGSGDPIQIRLLALLNIQPSISHSVSTIAGSSYGNNNYTNQNTVKRKFATDCRAHEVPEGQQLSVLHVMFRDEAERYFTDHVAGNATFVDDAFQQIYDHFVTPAHRDTYITEWNTLTFSDMKHKHPNKTTVQYLDLLYQRARDLQSMLDPVYQSPLLLRDCIMNAVKAEPFYTPLLTSPLPGDPDTLHTRLHQCIRQQDTISHINPQSSHSSKPTPVYHADTPDTDTVDDLDSFLPLDSFEVLYNDRGQPYFKRRIMRGSSSFSTPNYRGRQLYPQRFQHYRHRNNGLQRAPAPPSPQRKLRDRSGNVMHCSHCNSWFHLVRNCPDLQRYHINYTDNPSPLHDSPPDVEELPQIKFDQQLEDYNLHTIQETHDAHSQIHNQHLFMCLTHGQQHEFDRNSSFTYLHSDAAVTPTTKDVLSRYPHLQPDPTAIFHGFCFDEGAPQSVTGVNQWFAYLSTYHLPSSYHDIHQLQSTITFGESGKQKVKVSTIGRITIRVPLPGHTFFDYQSLLIHNDVPMLFGLATQTRLHTVTDKHPLHPVAHLNTLNITISLTLKFKHLYYIPHPSLDFLFSSSELAQIHRNLGHAPPGSIYSALRRAYPIETGASDLVKLQEISKSCKACQLNSITPNRYRVVLPEQCVFNFDVALDVMFIRSQPVLHAVCRRTHFSRATPLPKQDSYTIWESFMRIWVTPYLGVPYNLWVDQAKAFLSVQFKTLAASLGCNLVPIAAESHWPLIAKRYHDPLRRIAKKLSIDHPSAPLHLIIDYSNLAMSHTVGPEGFTPAILAFGAQPRLPIGQYDQMPQTSINRMDLMTAARREYEALVAALRTRRAMHTASPNEAALDVSPGDEVLVYREKTGWDGPYTFLYRDGRLSIVLDNKGLEHTFHSTMVKTYQRPTIPITDLLNPTDQPSNTLDIHLIEVIHDELDPRFTQSRQEEYDGILAKGGVKVVDANSIPPNSNIIGNRYVLTIKNPGTDVEKFKARWILQGHHDQYRNRIANDSPVLMRMMYKVIISISTTLFQCTLWTRDVEQAYMQSKPLNRDVYTVPPREANLSLDKLLKITLPHYGLVESSSCFFEAYYPVFTETLLMRSAAFDPCFLFHVRDNSLNGISGLATDDSLNTGNQQYQQDEREATKKFVTHTKESFPIRFLGCIINRIHNTITLCQNEHISRLKHTDIHTLDRDFFRTVRGQLLFIAQSSRPDISYAVAQLCQIPYEDISLQECQSLNLIATHLKETIELQLQYRPLDKHSTKLYVFTDSGYNSNRDKTSQLGLFICLVDKHDNCHTLHWASTKCQRITRSMLAGEVYSFSLGYDYGISLKLLLQQMSVNIPLFIFTDSKSIFDTITASKRLRELRLMNKVADFRRAYKHNEISNVAWIRSAQNIADNFTRREGNNILRETMRTGKIKFTIEQWVYKDDG